MSTTQGKTKKSTAAAKPAKATAAKSGAKAAPATAKGTVESKSKLLLTLKDDVVKLTKAVQSEHAERIKVQEWLAHTLKPGLAKQFADIREDMETQQQLITAVHKWIRDNKATVEDTDPELVRKQLSTVTRELEETRHELDEVRKEVAIEREARQQMLLWMRECFGKNLELLDVRIQSHVAAAIGKSTNSAGARNATNLKVSSAAVVAQAAEIVPESMSEWLRMIGYDRYIPIFKKYNMDDLDKCSRLEDRHLVKMGIDLKRHRSDIVSEIKTLKAKLASKNEKESGAGSTTQASSIPATPKRVTSIVVEAIGADSPSRTIEAAEAAEAAEEEAAARRAAEAEARRAADEAKKKEAEAAAAAEAAVEAAVAAAEAEAMAELVKEGQTEVVRGPTVDPFSDADVERKINREEERRRQWEEEKKQWMEAERERMRQEFMEEEQRKLKAEKERLRREAEEEVEREVAKKQAEMQEEARRKQKELEEQRHEQERKNKRRSVEREKRTTPKRSEVVEEQVVSVSSLSSRPRKTRRSRRTPHRSDRSGSESESANEYLTEGSDDESFHGNKRDVYGEPSMHDLSETPEEASNKSAAKSTTNRTVRATPPRPTEDYYSDDALASETAARPSVKKSASTASQDNKSHAARVTEVKSDYSPLDWVVFDFDKAGNKVTFGATGDGGLEEMREYIDDGKVQYGLLRLVEEDRRRVKFVFLVWLGPSSGVITKARSQTHKAAIMEDIGQFHLELISENREELTLDEVWKRLKAHVDF